MARLRTAEDLVADVLHRANLEYSDLVTPDEVLEYLNQELAELRTHIRLNEGQPHDRKVAPPIAVTAGISLYDLPSDFWEILGVEANLNGLVRRLEPYMENERAGLVNTQLINSMSSPMYRLASKTQLEILPAKFTFTATLKYVPSEPRLVLGASPPSTVDGYNGYEIAAVYGAVATCKEKELVDPSFYEARKARQYKLIEAAAAQRDAGAPERVTDVTGGLDDNLLFRYR